MQPITSKEDLFKIRESILKEINPDTPVITVCGGTGCSALGSQMFVDELEKEIAKRKLHGKVRIKRTGCHGFCEKGPLVVILPDEIFYQQVKPSDARHILEKTILQKKIIKNLLYTDPATGEKIVKEHDVPFYKKQMRLVFRHNGKITPESLEDYISLDGYQALVKVLTEMTPEQVVAEVKSSGLRGRGGAGFPTGQKWEFARNNAETKRYMICNGDEGDPGAFMDRSVMEGDPYAVIEGITIAGYAIGANTGYIYVRAEYPLAVKNLIHGIEVAKNAGLLGKNILGSGFDFDIIIKQGAGAFVCGEETALIASIEGKRGMPRPRPPFPAQSGLFGKPTVINNVETLANVPLIILKGAPWYAGIGTPGSKGTKIFALAGKINNTGLVEVPMGTTLRQIIFEIGGGIPRERKFKAVQMGGPSGGCVPAQYLDLPIDYESLKKVGAIMGSGGMIVMDETTCMVDIARYFLEFTQSESCGKCAPCRLGTKRMLETLQRITTGKGKPEDLNFLAELGDTVKETSLCGLGQTAPNPVLSTIRYFRNEYDTHILYSYCQSAGCEKLVKSPCQNSCPAGINVPQYIALTGLGEYERSHNLIRKRVPFPAVLGRVCFHPCETFCRRGDLDKPVSICHLKRYVADKVIGNTGKPMPKDAVKDLFPFNSPSYPPAKTGRKIAIIGAGPAGLSAAYFLALKGHSVTVFEAQKTAGGLLMLGIPAYRLPRDMVKKEIALIEKLGVTIKTNSPVGAKIPWKTLRENYDAVFISAGSHKGRKLGVPGEDSVSGIVDSVNFLRDANLGVLKKAPKRVIVVGGGNSAIDSARTSLRLGASDVTILYRRSIEEMPAHKEEIKDAENEGVKFMYLSAPTAVRPAENNSTELECVRMQLSEADESGRRKPVPVEDSNFTLPADLVITAISQTPDFSFIPKDAGIELTRDNLIKTSPYTMETTVKGVYAGGDCSTEGAGSVISAIAAGQHAGISIDIYLGGDGSLPENHDYLMTTTIDVKKDIRPASANRQAKEILPPEKRIQNFEEAICTYKNPVAEKEAKRCLRCDLQK